MPLVETLASLERSLSWRRTALVVLSGSLLIVLGSWLTGPARGAEPGRVSVTAGPSLKWRSSSVRTARIEPPAEAQSAPTADSGAPELIDVTDARPIAEASRPVRLTVPWPRRDEAVVPAQANAPASDALSDPFGDKASGAKPTPAQPQPAAAQPQPTPAQPRLLTQPAPAVAPTAPTAPLPPAGQALAQSGNNFKQEECPKIADLKKMSSLTTNIAASQGELPKECYFDERTTAPTNREWYQTMYHWKPSGLCHKPLYFEEEALERYGHSTGRISQPFVSAAQFFATVPVLPYKMGMSPPWECKYALGYYRPNSCAPYIIPPVPLSARGAANQAAATTGLILTLP